MLEQIDQVIPDKLIELRSRGHTRATRFSAARNDRIAFAYADIVTVGRRSAARPTDQKAMPATDQRAQQIFARCVVTRSEFLIVPEFLLHLRKLLRSNYGLNASD